uniref:Protein kinase domain-containing protein n=1 Tax=Ascaris lumbricoides TaxID=6252 RepID=A0A0M3IVQ4_ASCLU
EEKGNLAGGKFFFFKFQLTYVQENGAQSERLTQNWMCQLISAVRYMHMRWIAHRDLKLENILLFADKSVKIADFGFCREVKSEADMSFTFCGSKAYSAPEILLGRAYPPFKADEEKGNLAGGKFFFFKFQLTYVQENGAQSERLTQNWMCQLISAVRYMHMRWIAHRDLKLENILLFADKSVKIADFGFCREVKSEADMSFTFCGSKAYSAPEILLGRAYPPFKADVWSLGVIAFVIVTNRMPFDERVSSNTIIVNAQQERSYHYPRNLMISEACQQTIDTMMTFDYENRPNIHEAMNLPWFDIMKTFRRPRNDVHDAFKQHY